MISRRQESAHTRDVLKGTSAGQVVDARRESKRGKAAVWDSRSTDWKLPPSRVQFVSIIVQYGEIDTITGRFEWRGRGGWYNPNGFKTIDRHMIWAAEREARQSRFVRLAAQTEGGHVCAALAEWVDGRRR